MSSSEEEVAYSVRMATRPPATLSVAETATLLGVSEYAVKSAIDQDQIKAIRVGKYIRVLRAPLLEALGLPPDFDLAPPEQPL